LASVAESPTMTILPVQGEEFNNRILTPLDERRFQSLLLQGVPVDMVIRLMGDGLEFYKPEGGTQRSVMNWPGYQEEYQEFRRRASHLASLQASQTLFIGPLVLDEPVRTRLPAQLSPSEQLGALERGWRPVDAQTYELSRQTVGRVAVTNYDPQTVPNAERLALNARAG